MHSLQTIKDMNEKAEKAWKEKGESAEKTNQQAVLHAITLVLRFGESLTNHQREELQAKIICILSQVN